MAADRDAVIAKIREHYAALDIPLDELSDLDVEVGVRQLAAAAKEMGSSSEDINKAMREAVKAVSDAARERKGRAAAAAAEAEEGEAEDSAAGNGAAEADDAGEDSAADNAPAEDVA